MKECDEATRCNLIHTLEERILKATSILRLIANKLTGDSDGDGRLSDETIYFSIDSAIKEIEGMREVF